MVHRLNRTLASSRDCDCQDLAVVLRFAPLFLFLWKDALGSHDEDEEFPQMLSDGLSAERRWFWLCACLDDE